MLFKKINLFILIGGYFTILQWFLPYIDVNEPWLYMCSPSWTLLHLPPHPIPQGHPSAPALSAQSIEPGLAIYFTYNIHVSMLFSNHSTLAFSHRVLFDFFKFIYFNWRLITLHYCSGFCHTLTWISHGCTCVPHPEPPFPPPSQSHPSRLSLNLILIMCDLLNC